MSQTQNQVQDVKTQSPSINGDLFFEHWTTPDGVPPFDRIAPEHFRPAYARALAEHEAEIAAIAADPEPPTFDNTIAATGAERPRAGRVSATCFTSSPAPIPMTPCSRSSARFRRKLARHWNDINTNAALFAPHRRADARRRHARPHRRAEARHRALSYRLPPRRRRARRAGEKAPRRDHRAARGARHRVQPERARRRAGIYAALDERSRACRAARTSCARRWLATHRERGLDGHRRHAVAFERRAVPAILRAPRSAREDVSRLRSRAATMAARPTTRRSSPRWCGCAPSARGCSAMPTSPITGSTTPWRRRRRRCATCSTGVGAGARAGARRPRRHAGADRRRRAAISRSRRGTGATTPRSCASGAAISMRPRSSRIFKLDRMIEAAFYTAQRCSA